MPQNIDEYPEVCINCTSFYPDDEFFTELGICLNDESFKPYINELLEDGEIDHCRDLFNKKKFNGNSNTCEQFTLAKISEISENFDLNIDISEDKELIREKLLIALIEQNMKNTDLKNYPIDSYIKKLESNDKEQIRSGIINLGALINEGNNNAFTQLCAFFKELPPAQSLEDVQIKIDILEKLEYKRNTKEVATCLVKELYKTTSNNTTKRLILKIFYIMEKMPLDLIRDELKIMLKEKRFSYRLKKKMKNILASDL